jgi:hypothetical protein
MKGLQLDHIVPLRQARDVDEVISLWHYTNLRVVTARENHDKFDGITKEAADLCLVLLRRECDFTQTSHIETRTEHVFAPGVAQFEKSNRKRTGGRS